MKVSFAKQVINPTLPCHMDGYDDRISNGIHDDLEVRTFMLESKETVVIHVLDILLISNELSQSLKEILSKRFCLKENNIIILATHTHSGPKVSSYIFPDILPSQEYLSLIENTIVENTQRCLDTLVEAKAYFSITETENIFGNRNYIDAPYNNQLLSIQFRDMGEKPLLQIVNIACHPTVLAHNFKEISSDFFGTFRNEYERLTNIPLIIINGEAGDVSTRFTRKGQDYSEVERIGTQLATLLSEISEYSFISLDNLEVSVCEYENVYHPQEDQYVINTREKLVQLVSKMDSNEPGNAARDLLKKIESKLEKETIHYNYAAKMIEAKDFRIVTFPGELVTELGQKIRNASDKKIFIAAYADDFKGYAINKEAYGKIPETYTTEFPIGVADGFVNKIIESFEKN